MEAVFIPWNYEPRHCNFHNGENGNIMDDFAERIKKSLERKAAELQEHAKRDQQKRQEWDANVRAARHAAERVRTAIIVPTMEKFAKALEDSALFPGHFVVSQNEPNADTFSCVCESKASGPSRPLAYTITASAKVLKSQSPGGRQDFEILRTIVCRGSTTPDSNPERLHGEAAKPISVTSAEDDAPTREWYERQLHLCAEACIGFQSNANKTA
jgi:hypothetical protein